MKDLGLVIKANEGDIRKYIEVFKPLLLDHQSELIIVNNNIDSIDIPYHYSICKFSEKYSEFVKFCISTSASKMIMILEEGMIFTNEIVSFIYANILKICEEDFYNITLNYKTYINEKNEFFKRESVLLYNRGIKGFQKNIGITVEDFSLLKTDEKSIKDNIDKLIMGGYYNQLFLWYKTYILEIPAACQAQFYILLEKKKSLMSYDDIVMIETIFIKGITQDNSLLLDINEHRKYKNYLELKKLYREDKIKFFNQLDIYIENNNFDKKDVYYCWMLKELSSEKTDVFNFMKCFNGKFRRLLLMHLFDNEEYFINYFYNLIVDYSEEYMDSETLKIYLDILKIYIDSIKDISDSPERKNKLLYVFDLYLSYMTSNSYQSTISGNDNIAVQFMKVRELMKEDKLKYAFEILDKLCVSFPEYQKLIRFFIQKSRFEREYYPYMLSICMIVKDEEKNLDRCLLSIKPLVDSGIAQIIIVDTGSKDNTLQIAKKYTDNVFIHPWTGNFSEARNYSILFSDGEYIFILDADEEVKETEVKKLIVEFKNKSYKQYNTFTLKLISYTNNELSQYAILTHPRIFKNNGFFYYTSVVHNQPAYDYPIKNLDIEMLHYGYIMTEEIRDKKFRRTATLLKKQLEINPRSIYNRFQLSSSYAMYGDLKEALKQVDIYMRIIKEENITNDTVLMYYNHAVTIYINCLKYDEAERINDNALKIQPDFIDFIYYKVLIAFYKEKYYDSLIYIDKYMSLIDDYFKIEIANDGRFTLYSLGYKEEIIKTYIDANYRIGEYDNCINKIDSLKDNKLFKNCLHEIIYACFKTGRLNELAELYKNRIWCSSDLDLREVFMYFLFHNLFKYDEEKQKGVLEAFSCVGIDRDILRNIEYRQKEKRMLGEKENLLIIDKYDIDGMDFDSALDIIYKVAPLILNYTSQNDIEIEENMGIKKIAQLILHRAEQFINNNIIDAEGLVDIFQKYMFICSKFLKLNKLNLLEDRERLFIAKVLDAFEQLKEGNFEGSISCLRDSCLFYNNMRGIVELSIRILTQEHEGQMEEVNITVEKENNKMLLYISEVKAEIINTTGSHQGEKLISLFNKYNKCELYDCEIYNAKAIALMSQNFLDDAEECIIEGLRRFPQNYNLLINLSILYGLKHEHKKLIRAFGIAHMLWPQESINLEVLPPKILMGESANMKVLHGTMDLTNKTNTVVGALKNRGIYARSLNYITRYVGYSSDYVLDAHSIEQGEITRNRSITAAAELISDFNIFHFYYGTTLCFDHSDIPVLKALNKSIVMHFGGQEARVYSKALEFNPYIRYLANKDEAMIQRRLEKISKDIPTCVVNDFEVYEYVKDYFKSVYQINPMINMDDYKPVYHKSTKKRFTIVHAPTFNEIKGTRFILEAIDALKDKYDIDFRLVQGVPHEKAINIYREADLIIDQLIIGSYGQLSIEAMALGKPVICWISDFMKGKYPSDLPVIIANPENIKEKVEYTIKNKDMLHDIGSKGRHYVEKYHDINREIAKIIDLYATLNMKK